MDLIHGDFEPDNIFYDDKTKECMVIDFDNCINHWFLMDIVIALDNIKEEFPKHNFENGKRYFIDGYKIEYDFNDDELDVFPIFRRYDDICRYVRLKTVTEELWENEPDWMIGVRKNLRNVLEETEKRIGVT